MPDGKAILLFVYFSINTFSSILIIQINKYIYLNYGISNLVLTCLQFAITSLSLIVCAKLRIFKIVDIPIRKMIPMALTFCGFVVFTNYSLQFNSIGTYQCLKALTLPGILMILATKNTIYSFNVNLTAVTFSKLNFYFTLS